MNTRRIRTVLYGDQSFSEAELDLLHTPTLQRLYDLRQLGLADRVFVDASHTRFSHVLGTMEQADRLAAAIETNLLNYPETSIEFSTDEGQSSLQRSEFARILRNRRPSLRLIALLHDLTHAPFGHTLEDEIELVAEKHDTPARQSDAFLRLLIEWIAFQWLDVVDSISSENPTLPDRITAAFERYISQGEYYDLYEQNLITSELFSATEEAAKRLCTDNALERSPLSLPPSQILATLRHLQFAFRALFNLDFIHNRFASQEDEPGTYPVDALMAKIFRVLEVKIGVEDQFLICRDAYILDIIGNTICADLLDYAKRDAINSGINVTYDSKRIVENFTLTSYVLSHENHDSERVDTHPLRDKNLVRAAVALFSNKFRPGVVAELISILAARYYVYERMLFHPTKCIAGATLGAALQWMGWQSLPMYFRRRGDAVFLHEMREAALLTLRILVHYRGQNEYYTSLLADSLMPNEGPFSIAGNLESAALLLKDLAPNESPTLIRLTALKRLRHWKQRQKLCDAFFEGFKKLVNNWKIESTKVSESKQMGLAIASDTTDFHTVEALRAHLNTNFPRESEAIDELIHRELPKINQIVGRLRAALRLLHRLAARRYPRSVFSLLSGQVAASNHSHSSKAIADVFKQPAIRKIAEQEIEDKLQLPKGSAVIHCPSHKGPTKIANVLVTYGDFSTKQYSDVRRLVEIDKLEIPAKGIFKYHAQLILAMQGMYTSMWRLSVSVIRPYDSRVLNLGFESTVGRILRELVTDGERDESFANEPFTHRELLLRQDGIQDTPDTPVVIYSSEGVHRQSERDWRFSTALLAQAKNSPLLLQLMEDIAATSRTAEDEDGFALFSEKVQAAFAALEGQGIKEFKDR